MIVGFTGTREGLSWSQDAKLDELANCGEFGGDNHHGDCVGADASFHYFAWRYGGKVIVHPPTDPTHRAFVHSQPTDGSAVLWEDDYKLLPEKPYLERNRDIVDACELLYACPKEDRHGPLTWRGGTWSTIRYAKKQGKPVRIIWPDGSTSCV